MGPLSVHDLRLWSDAMALRAVRCVGRVAVPPHARTTHAHPSTRCVVFVHLCVLLSCVCRCACPCSSDVAAAGRQFPPNPGASSSCPAVPSHSIASHPH